MAKSKKQPMKRGVKLLILSDLLIYFGLGMTSPILAVFIKENLNSTIAAAGFAVTMFLIIKSLSQIIFSKIFSPKDRFKMVMGGAVMIAASPFICAFSTNIWHILLAQTVYGIGAGLTGPAWMSLFILNVSKKRPGFEWSVYSTILGIGMGIAAYVGGNLVELWNFKPVFLISGVLAISGMLVLLKLMNEKMK